MGSGKQVSRSAHIGDAGIALIHQRVSAMDHVWHERTVDAGIDRVAQPGLPVYVLATVSSMVSGRLADGPGRRAILPAGCGIAVTGVFVTLVPSLPAIIVGLAVLTVGFFVIQGLASGWVAARAHASGNSTSQAATFYLFSYYVGSSVFVNLDSAAWTFAG